MGDLATKHHKTWNSIIKLMYQTSDINAEFNIFKLPAFANVNMCGIESPRPLLLKKIQSPLTPGTETTWFSKRNFGCDMNIVIMFGAPFRFR